MENSPKKPGGEDGENLLTVLKEVRTAMKTISEVLNKKDDQVELRIANAKRMERYKVMAFFFGFPCVSLGAYVIFSLLIKLFI